jgi:uncharacterized ferritin-like protein (DUF455 family)
MLRINALAAIAISDIDDKLLATDAIDISADINTSSRLSPEHVIPGRPNRPELVSPAQLPKRSVSSLDGRAALIHALTHIEYNAIDLGLDIVWRFPDMPEQFYRDWIGVAKEESYHFKLLRGHLNSIGYSYGDYPAHNGLWEMAEKTKDDLLARLALVPRTLEARGLDVTPQIKEKLKQAGDPEAASILDIILRDEIGHVATGNRWYKFICGQRGLDPVAAYDDLAVRYRAPRLRGPFNIEARRAAGFDEEELSALQGK